MLVLGRTKHHKDLDARPAVMASSHNSSTTTAATTSAAASTSTRGHSFVVSERTRGPRQRDDTGNVKFKPEQHDDVMPCPPSFPQRDGRGRQARGRQPAHEEGDGGHESVRELADAHPTACRGSPPSLPRAHTASSEGQPRSYTHHLFLESSIVGIIIGKSGRRIAIIQARRRGRERGPAHQIRGGSTSVHLCS